MNEIIEPAYEDQSIEVVGDTPDENVTLPKVDPKPVRRSVLVSVSTHARLKLAVLKAEVETGEKTTIDDLIVKLLDYAGK